jgi:hypothetical protein
MTLHFEELQSAILPVWSKKSGTKLLEVWAQLTIAGHLHGTASPNNQNRRTAQNSFANFLEGLQKKNKP